MLKSAKLALVKACSVVLTVGLITNFQHSFYKTSTSNANVRNELHFSVVI